MIVSDFVTMFGQGQSAGRSRENGHVHTRGAGGAREQALLDVDDRFDHGVAGKLGRTGSWGS
jgi:hypothetical protein